MKHSQVILLIGFLYINSVLGQLATCSSSQQCVRFSDCPDVRKYTGPSQNWPPSVQKYVKSRFCKFEKHAGQNIYSVCCDSRNMPTNTLSAPWGYPISSHQPKGLDLLDMKACGKDSSERIAFGKNAKVFSYPWMALLIDINEQIRCGGTLITESYVLTAAHCNRPPIATVRLGENDITKKIDCNDFDGEESDCADPPQNIGVSRFIRHPMYSSSKRRNDIALIKLAEPAKLSYSVKTICLPIGPMVRNPLPKEMIITGWGFTEKRRTSNVLQYATVPILENNRCASTLAKLNDAITLDDSSQLCAGGVNKVDNCAGDSGGPLQYFSRTSAAVQYGIVAFGVDSCGDKTAPGVYTRVSYYIDWILQNLE
ncbi:phenoloxidase-activating factor 3-like [Wyeomyia smithii]|uniref:phenoloxidase-activating factor 3-like n=1 Tax=Wyeomyia smithii TaxID=174621 RepID=UPI002468113F|nr:phenoloxidase-activating factor 3-like [Wyeomyia smithii]